MSAPPYRRFTSAHLAAPRTHLLSNGRYSVMLTEAGSGYSQWQDLAVTRWREDPTRDCYGQYVFLRDVRDGEVWSAGYQPVGHEPESYEVNFHEERVEIVRKDGPIITSLECLVSSEDDVEVRRVSLTNQARTTREIELTSYAEIVLGHPGADAAHPAFSKMFVLTEALEPGALLATRRPRDAAERELWAVHFSTLEGQGIGSPQFETDRARFLGRGHELRNALSVFDARPLSNTVGTVLDPIFALRRRVRVEPRETVSVSFFTGVAAARTQALALLKKYSPADALARVRSGARTQAAEVLEQLGASAKDAQAYQELASRVLYFDASLRAPAEVLSRNRGNARGLWALGISGDLPIVLLKIGSAAGLSMVAQLLRAQEYWRRKGLIVDVVVQNDVASPAGNEVQAALETSIAGFKAHLAAEQVARGAITPLRGEALSQVAQDLLATAARAVLQAQGEDLSALAVRGVALAPRRRRRRENLDAAARASGARSPAALEFFNGLGGFAADGREYVITLHDAHWTPAPWVNVIANRDFGFLASADGTGSTWSRNAQQNQITPWCNDPVSNPPAEIIYIRDEKTGDLWSATPLPIREPSSSYLVRHGFGYTRSEHSSHGIALELTQFVPLEDPVKISRLKLSNRSGERRRVSVTFYADWVLGNNRARNAPFIVTSRDPKSGALFALNPWSLDYQGEIAFMDVGARHATCCGDRTEFLGRHGSLAEPVALLGLNELPNTVGAGLDPCGALQTVVELGVDESVELTLLLGAGASEAAATALVERWRAAQTEAALKEVVEFWDRTLNVLQVKTPDRSMDLMLNGWLLYQTLACRVWGRTAFYQSSGAYGYRDQLQDVMALCIAAPAITREHILRAAARQFAAGDVQHWWLPTTGQGIKTRVADDRLWLPFVVARYLEVTADQAILDEPVAFLEGGPLPAGENEQFAAPSSTAPAPLFEHCVRSLDSSLAIGTHGLPLFGTGDWNDGMNRVGVAGRGESVWMGWFLYATLLRFADIAAGRGAGEKAAEWRKHAFGLQQAIEREAWDGDWYRRGYFDDGTPLGSVMSDECRIDSIAQSWAVISGGGERGHAVRAMMAVNAQLVSRSDGLIKLFTPAFDETPHDPGYIKAYPPGLRENGGQYTHAATWTVLAFGLLGNGDRAAELFSLLNPVNHASTRAGIHRYMVEPYVICADLYAAPGHVGRGGWTWYTGSAGWMYRTGVEGILGINLRGDTLHLTPCLPKTWNGFEFTLKYKSSRYRIEVENRRGNERSAVSLTLDGQEQPSGTTVVKLVDDGRYHYGKMLL